MSARSDTTNADDWLQHWTVPEEDRAKFTSEPWRGEARWFRAPNVVCLESRRRPKAFPCGKPEQGGPDAP